MTVLELLTDPFWVALTGFNTRTLNGKTVVTANCENMPYPDMRRGLFYLISACDDADITLEITDPTVKCPTAFSDQYCKVQVLLAKEIYKP